MHSRKWRCQVPPWGVVAGPPLTFSVQTPGLSCGGGKHFHGTLRLHSHSVWHTGTHFFLPVLIVVSRCSPSTRKYTFFLSMILLHAPSSFPPQGLCTGCFPCLGHPSPPPGWLLLVQASVPGMSPQRDPPMSWVTLLCWVFLKFFAFAR